ncbi:Uncharacterized protein FKW44_021426 [Caligus rogercresseyi]|uniref:Uncharacterized protein n=1 Tax=Caligus rogercresseyi TaxID=217165 RepID=A0A7T8JVT5_CALRO|nr:Uncharacterized protein FKW44_021426 [Caligus rogercresseyi]
MPHIQDKDFYSNWDPAALGDEGQLRRGRGLPRLLRQVRSRQAVSAGREHGRRHAAESRHDPGMHFRNFTQKVLLKSKTEEVERHLEATRIQSTYGYT